MAFLKKIRTLFLFTTFVIFTVGMATTFKLVAEAKLPTKQRPITFYSSQTGQDLRDHYLAAIESANKSITLIIFTMRDRMVINALNNRAQEGIDVTVIYDANAASNLDRHLSQNVTKIKRNPEGITHQKILIVDHEFVLVGTSNMTTSSLRYYDNLVNGFWSPELARWLSNKLGQLKAFNDGPGGRKEFTIDHQSIDFWFLPAGDQAPEQIKKLIRLSKKSLRIAMFTWTRLDFAEEVIRAHQRGVDVKVVIDKQSGYGASLKVIQVLQEAGVPLFFNNGKELMHTKTMSIDDKILVNGSANWTKSAFTRNDDCFYVLPALTSEQQKFMNNFWNFIFLKSVSVYSESI